MNTTARFSTSANWLQTMKQEGFYFRQVGIFVIAIGFYLHLTRLFVGDTILIQYILTPLFDQLFAIPMAFAGIAGIMSWKRMAFTSNAHKVFVRFIVIYITVSIPFILPRTLHSPLNLRGCFQYG